MKEFLIHVGSIMLFLCLGYQFARVPHTWWARKGG